ncbi:hypothetical protein NA56DRAFT_701810 [Hyaloscypha hepaticicola]|uniref:Uncharacterized protein n=1 Tax=Hyaloscypha hepaticicola TaxID=2082293 RepID=A0A2J6Q914_9HELO|nr:hypothetical protein NA56DRAFT_701810 [Hyaloscypha hepaticicola]
MAKTQGWIFTSQITATLLSIPEDLTALAMLHSIMRLPMVRARPWIFTKRSPTRCPKLEDDTPLLLALKLGTEDATLVLIEKGARATYLNDEIQHLSVYGSIAQLCESYGKSP